MLLQRPHLRDETIGASTRGLVRFYRESQAKAETNKALVVQQSKLNERPVIQYERNDEENIVSKVTVVHSLDYEELMSNGYVPEDRLIESYDLNDLNTSRTQVNSARKEDHCVMDDHIISESSSERSGAGLGALYNNAKVTRPLPSRTLLDDQKSSFGSIVQDNTEDDSSRIVIREQVKRRPLPGRKNDVATLHAKNFFDMAKSTLAKDDLLKLNKLLVAMKGYGDAKDEQQYVKASKELMSLLVDSQVNTTRIQLISSLFPLLPIKYRYKIEKMAAALVFDKSSLTSQCKHLFPEEEFSSVRNFVLPIIFKQSNSNDPSIGSDRALLEDTQKIIAILMKSDVNLQYFFDLIPARQLIRVRALVFEMERSRDIAKAKERSSGFQGEVCVNTALFQPAGQKPSPVALVPERLLEDAESQRIMTQALSQGLDVNRNRKNRVNEPQKFDNDIAKPFNPYRQTALKVSAQRNQLCDSHAAMSKNPLNSVSAVSQNTNTLLDVVDVCLHQVKSKGFVKPLSRLERINGKINARVPKGMTCMLCNENLDQVSRKYFYRFNGHSSISNWKIACVTSL